MADFDDDLDKLDDEGSSSKINKKKILIFLLPVLIVVGIAAGMYHTFGSKSIDTAKLPYNVVQKTSETDGKASTQLLIFYDLPEISTQIKTHDGSKEIVHIKISIELSKMEDIKTIEALLPRFNDIIINHTSELTSDEINGANGLYWLKEELLYRINLVAAPIKIENLNFKSFEVQKNS